MCNLWNSTTKQRQNFIRWINVSNCTLCETRLCWLLESLYAQCALHIDRADSFTWMVFGFKFPVSLRYCWIVECYFIKWLNVFILKKKKKEYAFMSELKLKRCFPENEILRWQFHHVKDDDHFSIGEEPERGRIFWIDSRNSFRGTSLFPCSLQNYYFPFSEWGATVWTWIFLSLLKL